MYKEAFYWALRNTLVVPDLVIGRKSGYGKDRHRVVTLDGSLIENSGAMSGGGQPKSGGMKSEAVRKCDYSEQEINDLRNEIAEL